MEATAKDKQSLGDYMLMDPIGKGSFGVVYRALNRTKGFFVAVKKLNSKKELMDSLMTEINLLKSLSHRNIVKYIEHVATESNVYIIMEFIENGSLSSLVKKHGFLPEALVAKYMAQVLEGLSYLHRQGVIHRDIGANLLICTDGTIKLTDFGVSTRYDLLSKSKDDVAGTPNWMAPEIIQMQPATIACDIWSVGITVIELLTGNPPYSDMPQQAAIYRIVMADHPPLPPGISHGLEDFLMLCFKKDENLRASADQLLVHSWIRSGEKNPVADSEHTFEQTKEEIVKFNKQLQVARKASISLPHGMLPSFAKAPSMPEMGSMRQRSSGAPVLPHKAPSKPALVELPSKVSSFPDFIDLDGSEDPSDGLAVQDLPKLKLKVQAWTEDEEPSWDDEFAETTKESDMERAKHLLHDDIITELNRISMVDPEAAAEACLRLNEIFSAQPQEVIVLVQPTLAMPFVEHKLKNELPVVSMLELLKKCVGNKKLAPTSNAIIKAITTASTASFDVLSIVVSLQGIQLITEFLKPNHSYDTRILAASFLNGLALNTNAHHMFLASNGLESIASLLMYTYSSSRELCHIAVDCLWSLLTNLEPMSRSPLCHILIGYNITESLTTVLNSMLCGKEGFDDTHLTRGIDTLLTLASIGYLPFRRTLCTKSVLDKFQAMLKACRMPQSKVHVSFLLSLLKVIHHVSAEESMGDLLEPVIDSLIPLLGLDIPVSISGPRKRSVTEINNQVLHILYNLCSLSPARAARAASAGVLPLIHRSVKEAWPMKELALPILFNLLRMSPKSRGLLWSSGSLLVLLDLLEDRTWYVEACDCISQWLVDDPDLVSPVLQEPKNCHKIKNLICTQGKSRTFSKILPAILAMVKRSGDLATSLVEMGVLVDILGAISQEKQPVARVTLLKLMLALYENATIPVAQQDHASASLPPVTPRVSHLAIPAVEELSKNDPSELVRGLARDIVAVLHKRGDSGSAMPAPSQSGGGTIGGKKATSFLSVFKR